MLEYFGDDWAPLEARVEPGHHFEWVWLLHEFERLTGEDQGQVIASLMDFGLKGVDAEGLAIDEMDAGGHWLVRSRKLWAQTEMLKALIVLAERGAKASEWRIPALVDAIFERFMVPGEAPLWFEAIAEDGQPLRTRMPATTLYHLMLGFMELRRFAAASRQ
ncbi:MAG: AGE family epimerase/isomerase [Parvibaculaceae bacterium]|nr:AGE family epimerase/isomerase [Parvibaculaceae bacterium]